ncbi:hypothetical protein VOLCADRAFT_120520 [Volvox carteri f. nagariensis]|uniref:Ubiquitin-like domain-containing protein n=1 Tax=Volvox carteri f. nagariensis TaxID=3068 RepID=D8TNH3_VOLCA|nr:uncharacterized protein VOLCADRAFT_120520 [Volvox carteri f. nagariensis]EFJ50840.1 hypothetical protein VOLCADRAFT_120520 [Volvox carteri f. nagariensis]|eukprot:XP_002947852.1 hypothetical protein VOLCADRAFT_120520 [Volvox carteri f. nagariensis]
MIDAGSSVSPYASARASRPKGSTTGGTRSCPPVGVVRPCRLAATLLGPAPEAPHLPPTCCPLVALPPGKEKRDSTAAAPWPPAGARWLAPPAARAPPAPTPAPEGRLPPAPPALVSSQLPACWSPLLALPLQVHQKPIAGVQRVWCSPPPSSALEAAAAAPMPMALSVTDQLGTSGAPEFLVWLWLLWGLDLAAAAAWEAPGREASRLVFVFVKDVRPKRKVAVPVPDGYTWQDFIQQVKSKLRITGVSEVFLASSGQKVTSLDELQDIDELCVVEGAEPHAGNGPMPMASEAALRTGMAPSTSEIHPQAGQQSEPRAQLLVDSSKRKVIAADGGSSSTAVVVDDKKYARRPPAWKRTLQRLFPSLFQPGLPVTIKDAAVAEERSSVPGSRRPRRRRAGLSARDILLLLAVCCCLATLFWFMRSNVKLS